MITPDLAVFGGEVVDEWSVAEGEVAEINAWLAGYSLSDLPGANPIRNKNAIALSGLALALGTLGERSQTDDRFGKGLRACAVLGGLFEGPRYMAIHEQHADKLMVAEPSTYLRLLSGCNLP